MAKMSRPSNVILKITILSAFTTGLFFQDLSQIFAISLKNSGLTCLSISIPFISAYLVYRRRNMIRVTAEIENNYMPQKMKRLLTTIGFLTVALSLLLFWYGSFSNLILTYHLLALPIFLAGIVLVFFNYQTLRQILSPLALLFILTPIPSGILQTFNVSLSNLTSQVSVSIVKVLGVNANVTQGPANSIISISTVYGSLAQFTISYSLIYCVEAAFLFGGVLAFCIRTSMLKKLIILFFAFQVFFALNILRVTFLIALSYQYSESLGVQVFHLLGGWILGLSVLLIVVLAAQKIIKIQIFPNDIREYIQTNFHPPLSFHKIDIGSKQITKNIPKSDLIKIAFIFFCLVSLFFIQTSSFNIAHEQPSAVTIDALTGHQNATDIFPHISKYTIQFVQRDLETERAQNEDMAVFYQCVPENTSGTTFLLSVEIGTSQRSVPNWEDSLINVPIKWGIVPTVSKIEANQAQISEKNQETGNFFAFQYVKTNQIEAVYYWYEFTVCSDNSSTNFKWVETSIIAFPGSAQDLSQVQSQMRYIAKSIVDYWQPLNESSSITFIMVNYGLLLVTAIICILLAGTILFAFQQSKQRNGSKKSYRKLCDEKKQIIKILQEEKYNPQNITSFLEKLTTSLNISNKDINQDQVLNHLRELEEVGIIKAEVHNLNDVPVVVWTTPFEKTTKKNQTKLDTN